MESFSPRDIAAIQARFRKFNSTGGSDDFTPPQNTPPDIPPPNFLHEMSTTPPKTTAKTTHRNTPAGKTSKKIQQSIVVPKPIKVHGKAGQRPSLTAEQIASRKRPPKIDPLLAINTEIGAIPIAEELTAKLRSFQVRHVQNLQYVIEHNTIAFDGSDTGTGKTYTGAALAKNKDLSLIVICPKPVIPNWHTVAHDMGVPVLMIVNYETLKNGRYYPTLTDYQEDTREECPYITITRSEVVDSMTQEPVMNENGSVKTKVTAVKWNFPDNCLVIFDEAHKGKNGLNASIPTINSRMMVSTKQFFSQTRRVYGLFLSATITDKLSNFDVIAFLLGMYKPYIKKSYKMFLRGMTSDPTNLLERIHAKIFPRLGSRMNIKTIKASGNQTFKENIVKARAYEIDKESAAEIEEAHEQIKNAMIQLRHRMETDGPHPFVVILRARQKIEMLKVPIFVRLIRQYYGLDPFVDELGIETMVDSPKSIMTFVSFNETIELLTEKLIESGIDLEQMDYIRGGQTAEERSDIISSFQDDSLNILICNIQAGGISISLHDLIGNRQRVSFITPSWSSIELKQVLGRGYRADALTDMLQFIVYAKSPNAFGNDDEMGIEEVMCAAANEKLRNISLLNDGDLQNYDDYTSAEMHV